MSKKKGRPPGAKFPYDLRVRIPEDLQWELRREALNKDTSMSEVVRDILVSYTQETEDLRQQHN